MAYSKLITDPRFEQYIKNKKKWALIFAIIISVAVIVGFFIYGNNSSEMDNPEAIYIGLGIAGMFMVIGLYSAISINFIKTWDGEVIKKENKLKKRKMQYDNTNSYQEYMEFKVIIKQNDSGKIHEITADNDDTVFNYYNIGDKVRHHKKLNSYEKFDKSKDTIIFCAACASLHEIKENTCKRCGCPLLK